MQQPHFNVSVAEVGDYLPNYCQEPMRNRTLYVHNNRVRTPSYSLWRMQSHEARELVAALIHAADHMDRVPPHRPVWTAG